MLRVQQGLMLALATTLVATRAVAAESPRSTIVWMEQKCIISGASAKGLPQKEIAPVVAGILGALIPAVVNRSVDALAASLQAKASDKERKISGSFGDSFYVTDAQTGRLDPGDRLGCLTMGYGPFQPRTTATPLAADFVANLTDLQQQQLAEAGITATPDLYIESSIEFSTDRTAFRLLPQAIYYGRSLRGKNSGDFRGVALIATFRAPMATDGATSFAIGTMAFGNVRPGNSYRSGDLGTGQSWGPTSNWMPMPALDERTKTALQAYVQNQGTAAASSQKLKWLLDQQDSSREPLKAHTQFQYAGTLLCPFARNASGNVTDKQRYEELAVRIASHQADKARLDTALSNAPAAKKPPIQREIADVTLRLDALNACQSAETAQDAVVSAKPQLAKVSPFDVNVTVVESFEPSKFLTWTAGVLTDSKSGIQTAITDAVDPTKRADAREAEAKARAAAEYTAREAYATAKKAELDVSDAEGDSDRARKQYDLELAKRKANRAYADLEWAIPFPDVWP